jgi:hypothetical protein
MWHAIGHGKQRQTKPRSKKAEEEDSEVRSPETGLESALACDLNRHESREAADRIAIRLLRGFPRPPILLSSEAESNAQLCRERNAHRSARSEEIAQSSRGHAKLIQAGNRLRLRASRVQAERRGVADVIDARW